MRRRLRSSDKSNKKTIRRGISNDVLLAHKEKLASIYERLHMWINWALARYLSAAAIPTDFRGRKLHISPSRLMQSLLDPITQVRRRQHFHIRPKA